MALLYPWATKEYLLWDMSLAQIILYHNVGIEISYPQADAQQDKPGGVKAMTAEQRRIAIEEAKKMMAQDKQRSEQAASDAKKAPLAAKYGAI